MLEFTPSINPRSRSSSRQPSGEPNVRGRGGERRTARCCSASLPESQFPAWGSSEEAALDALRKSGGKLPVNFWEVQRVCAAGQSVRGAAGARLRRAMLAAELRAERVPAGGLMGMLH